MRRSSFIYIDSNLKKLLWVFHFSYKNTKFKKEKIAIKTRCRQFLVWITYCRQKSNSKPVVKVHLQSYRRISWPNMIGHRFFWTFHLKKYKNKYFWSLKKQFDSTFIANKQMYFSKATLRMVGLKMENSAINKSIKIAKLPHWSKSTFFLLFLKKNLWN